jgi:hypothetical protein
MKVGRFQVMATLQAARAKELGLPVTRAKSWGLNRAIFNAAAKRGFKHPAKPTGRGIVGKKSVAPPGKTYFLGDEMAYTARKSNRVYFTIGGTLQTETDFKTQIEARFGKQFAEAWKESLAIVHQYPKDVPLSQHRFFGEVYRPRRDELASKWTNQSNE